MGIEINWEEKGEKKGKINKEQNKPCYHAPSVLD